MSISQADVINYIKDLKLSEVKSLIESLEDELGVSASAPVMMGAMPGGAAPAAEAAEEKTEFDVVISEFDAKAKLKIIKAVRTMTDLGLKEAKELVENTPATVKEAISKDMAEEYKKTLEEAGAKVDLK